MKTGVNINAARAEFAAVHYKLAEEIIARQKPLTLQDIYTALFAVEGDEYMHPWHEGFKQFTFMTKQLEALRSMGQVAVPAIVRTAGSLGGDVTVPGLIDMRKLEPDEPLYQLKLQVSREYGWISSQFILNALSTVTGERPAKRRMSKPCEAMLGRITVRPQYGSRDQYYTGWILTDKAKISKRISDDGSIARAYVGFAAVAGDIARIA